MSKKLDKVRENLDKLDKVFNDNPQTWVTTRKKLGPDHFQILTTDGVIATAKLVTVKDYYKRLLIRRYGR